MNLRLPVFIARRYFFSKKSQRVINIISLISAVGVTIGTAALIIVLSVFNGFEDLILRLYNSFDPDLKVELNIGKSFPDSAIHIDRIRNIDGVEYVSGIIEESALAKFRDRQYIITLKGVSDDYEKMTGLDTMIYDGNFRLHSGDKDYAILGSAVAYNLGVDLSNVFGQLEIFGPKSSAASLSDPEGAFNRRFISPAAFFSVQKEYDDKYVIVPLRFAEEVFDMPHRLTSLEVGLKNGTDMQAASKQLQAEVGSEFTVKTRYQLHELMYKIMRTEKWAVFLILTFILVIAIFNVISSLTMLVIEKKKDIAIYRSMGAEVSFLRSVFLLEGMFITFAGSLAGILVGAIISYIQQRYGLITLGGSGSFVIDAYPVKMKAMDFLYIFLTVNFIGLIAAWYPARRLIRRQINFRAITDDK